MGTHHAEPMDIVGEVVAVDVRSRRFELVTEENLCFSIPFSIEQEPQVLSAMAGHEHLGLRIKGLGSHVSGNGKESLEGVEEIEVVPRPPEAHPEVRFIGDVLAELGRSIPREEWEQLPADLSENLDHYLYGAPKG